MRRGAIVNLILAYQFSLVVASATVKGEALSDEDQSFDWQELSSKDESGKPSEHRLAVKRSSTGEFTVKPVMAADGQPMGFNFGGGGGIVLRDGTQMNFGGGGGVYFGNGGEAEHAAEKNHFDADHHPVGPPGSEADAKVRHGHPFVEHQGRVQSAVGKAGGRAILEADESYDPAPYAPLAPGLYLPEEEQKNVTELPSGLGNSDYKQKFSVGRSVAQIFTHILNKMLSIDDGDSSPHTMAADEPRPAATEESCKTVHMELFHSTICAEACLPATAAAKVIDDSLGTGIVSGPCPEVQFNPKTPSLTTATSFEDGHGPSPLRVGVYFVSTDGAAEEATDDDRSQTSLNECLHKAFSKWDLPSDCQGKLEGSEVLEAVYKCFHKFTSGTRTQKPLSSQLSAGVEVGESEKTDTKDHSESIKVLSRMLTNGVQNAPFLSDQWLGEQISIFVDCLELSCDTSTSFGGLFYDSAMQLELFEPQSCEEAASELNITGWCAKPKEFDLFTGSPVVARVFYRSYDNTTTDNSDEAEKESDMNDGFFDIMAYHKWFNQTDKRMKDKLEGQQQNRGDALEADPSHFSEGQLSGRDSSPSHTGHLRKEHTKAGDPPCFCDSHDCDCKNHEPNAKSSPMSSDRVDSKPNGYNAYGWTEHGEHSFEGFPGFPMNGDDLDLACRFVKCPESRPVCKMGVCKSRSTKENSDQEIKESSDIDFTDAHCQPDFPKMCKHHSDTKHKPLLCNVPKEAKKLNRCPAGMSCEWACKAKFSDKSCQSWRSGCAPSQLILTQ